VALVDLVNVFLGSGGEGTGARACVVVVVVIVVVVVVVVVVVSLVRENPVTNNTTGFGNGMDPQATWARSLMHMIQEAAILARSCLSPPQEVACFMRLVCVSAHVLDHHSGPDTTSDLWVP